MQENEILEEIRQGRLAHVLDKIPLEEWKKPNNPYMWAAIRVKGNEKAVGYLIRLGASLLGYTTTVLHCTLYSSMYETICANATSLSFPVGPDGFTALYHKLRLGQITRARILIKHGARIRDCQYFADETIIAFQHAVLNCRTATVAMIQLKKHLNVDKFLLTYMSRFVWATRDDDEWQSKYDICALQAIEFHKREIERLNDEKEKIQDRILDEEMEISICRNDMIENQ